MVEESSTGAAGLSKKTSELSELLGRFEVGEVAPVRAPERGSLPAAAAPPSERRRANPVAALNARA